MQVLHSRIGAVAKTFPGASVRGETTGVDRLSLSLSVKYCSLGHCDGVQGTFKKLPRASLSRSRSRNLAKEKKWRDERDSSKEIYNNTSARTAQPARERERKINTHTRSRLAGSLYTYIHGCVCVYGCVGKCVCAKKRARGLEVAEKRKKENETSKSRTGKRRKKLVVVKCTSFNNRTARQGVVHMSESGGRLSNASFFLRLFCWRAPEDPEGGPAKYLAMPKIDPPPAV